MVLVFPRIAFPKKEVDCGAAEQFGAKVFLTIWYKDPWLKPL